MASTSPHPIRWKRWDDDLQTNVSRLLGFKQVCDQCGHTLRGYTVRQLRDRMRDHKRAHG